MAKQTTVGLKRNGTEQRAREDVPEGISLDSTRGKEQIAIAAYLRAEQRGFTPGHELDDWLASEADVLGQRKADVSAHE